MQSWIRRNPRATVAAMLFSVVLSAIVALALKLRSPAEARALSPRIEGPPSARWLALLPEGERKRQFIVDCTGCHQLDDRHAMPGGVPRSAAAWEEAIERMVKRSGPTTRFPVISSSLDAAPTAKWLAEHLSTWPKVVPTPDSIPAEVREYHMPMTGDLPHDLAVQRDGKVVITGMVSNKMYVLDPASGEMKAVDIPGVFANPRAIDIDSTGNWWVVLGIPKKVARYTPDKREWDLFDVDMYAHSVALSNQGQVWVNGHFTKEPPLLAAVDPRSGSIRRVALPDHPELSGRPGGPIPYEIRAAPDGRIWTSELQGNRIVMHDPRSGESEAYGMPVSHSGPRRFDIDPHGDLWIPAYGANELVRFSPASRTFRRWPLPVEDAAPYVVRMDTARKRLWIGTGAADAVLLFEPGSEEFRVIPLPARGALVRHLAVDPRSGDLWVAYGATPGIAARVARVRMLPAR